MHGLRLLGDTYENMIIRIATRIMKPPGILHHMEDSV